MSVKFTTYICSEARTIDDFKSTFPIQGKCKHIFVSNIDDIKNKWCRNMHVGTVYKFNIMSEIKDFKLRRGDGSF